jgi:hypothetical protein
MARPAIEREDNIMTNLTITDLIQDILDRPLTDDYTEDDRCDDIDERLLEIKADREAKARSLLSAGSTASQAEINAALDAVHEIKTRISSAKESRAYRARARAAIVQQFVDEDMARDAGQAEAHMGTVTVVNPTRRPRRFRPLGR